MKQIPLTQGKFAIVDDEDYPYLSRFKWYYHRLPDGEEYAATGMYVGKRTFNIPMHYFLTERKNGLVILFKNKNSLDNRKENLLMVSASESRHQTRKYKMRDDNHTGIRSKFKGLCWHPVLKKWQVSIIKGKKRTYVGVFASEIDAARAYNEKALELYGELAYQNQIP
jgi:hypothetical protein